MKLNPCPVCGSINLKWDAEAYNGRLYVECKDCETRFYLYGQNIQQAIDKYNSMAKSKNKCDTCALNYACDDYDKHHCKENNYCRYEEII